MGFKGQWYCLHPKPALHCPGLQPNCRITREQVRSRVLCVAFCHRCSSCKAVTHSFDSMKRDSIRYGCKLIVKRLLLISDPSNRGQPVDGSLNSAFTYSALACLRIGNVGTIAKRGNSSHGIP